MVASGREWTIDKVYLYSVANKKQTPITDDWYTSGNVSFSDDGKYLMLSSARDFKPTFGEEEFENVYRDMQRVYLVTLSKDTEPPLGPRSDEVNKKKKDEGQRNWRKEGRR